MNNQGGSDIPYLSTMLDLNAIILLGNGSIPIASYCSFVA